MVLMKQFFKTKYFLILLTSGLFMFGTLWLGSHNDTRPSFQHQRLYSDRTQLASQQNMYKNFPDMREIVDYLGFHRLFNQTDKLATSHEVDMLEFNKPHWELSLPSWVDRKKPVLVTALFVDDKDKYTSQLYMIASVMKYASDVHLLIFNMREEKEKKEYTSDDRVEVYCNISKICSFHHVDLEQLDKLDFNIKEDVGAYKPVLVMKALEKFSTVMWIDSTSVLSSNLSTTWKDINRNNRDLIVYPLENNCPAVSYTYKTMLPYFNLNPDQLKFVHMIESGSYVFRNTERTKAVMKLWLSCALTQECIDPVGADTRQCKYDSCESFQPRFTYLKCHKYETSALRASLVNITLEGMNGGIESDNYPLLRARNTKMLDTEYNITSINLSVTNERMNIDKANSRRKVNSL